MQYDQIAEKLSGVADGSVTLTPEEQGFVNSDLRAQASLAQYRKMLRGLAQLRDQVFEPPAGLLTNTLSVISEASVQTRRVSKKTVAYAGAIGGAALALSGAAVTAAVLVARSRKRAIALSS